MKNILDGLNLAFISVARVFSISVILAVTVTIALIMPDTIWPFSVNVFSLGHSFIGAFCVAITAAFLLLLSFEFFKISYAMIKYHKDPNSKTGYIVLPDMLPMLKPDKNIARWNVALYAASFVFALSLFVWMSSFWGMLHSPFQLGDGYIYLRHVAFFCALTPAPFLLYKLTKVLFENSVMMEDSPAPITVIFMIVCTIFYIGYFQNQ